jgi:tetratricopeptide (TPR) repeat protein/predicted Ser/Thr protein kinase
VDTLGRYQLQGEVARGGMGAVYKALDPVSGRTVALKVLLGDRHDPRIVQEVRSLARLQHPGIVAFHDHAEDQGRAFLVMEWVEGETLRQRLHREGPLPLAQALEATAELCDALRHAHERGVLHRDLKPQNVLVTPEGTLKLIDFGLGKVAAQSQTRRMESLTEPGDVLGSPAYMPPEQAKGDKEAMGPRSDVYGLGATLYALLTGRPPFKGETPVNLLYAVVGKDPDPPSRFRPGLPPEVDAVVLRCLAKRPEDRYASVGALQEELESLRGQAADATPSPYVPGRWWPAGVAAGCIVLGLSAAVTWGGSPSLASPTPHPLAQRPSSAPSTPARSEFEMTCDEAQAALKVGRYADAQRAFDQAIRLDPTQAGAYYGRGLARHYLRDAKGAMNDYEGAIQLDPQHVDAHHKLGLELGQAGDYTQALQHLEEALRLDPDHAQAHCHRAYTLGKLGDWEGAVAGYTDALALNPSNVTWWVNRANARTRARDYRGAIDDCGRALDLDPKLPLALLARGTAKGSLGDHLGAASDFERALELKPDLVEARRNLARARRLSEDEQK